jgi:hypothetical protein
MNCFDRKDLGNHLLQLCPKVMKHPVYSTDIQYVWPPLLYKLVCVSQLTIELKHVGERLDETTVYAS